MRQQSPSLKGSRVSSAQQNNSIAVSQIEKGKNDKQQPTVSKHEKMKQYAEQKQNVSKQHEPIEPSKIIEQNNKLKEQLQELVTHLDNIVKHQKEKQKQEKEKKLQKPLEPLEKKSQLNQQEKQINDNIVIIKQLQKQLEQTYDINKIKEKEDKKKYLSNEYSKLYKEYQSQQKIDQKQNEGLKQMDLKEQEQQIKDIKTQLEDEKKLFREVTVKSNNVEKELQKLHNEKVTKQKTIQSLQQKIQKKKQNKQVDEEIDDTKLQELDQEIFELQKKRDEQQKLYGDKKKRLEQDRNQIKQDVEKKRSFLIKLERDIKINKVFIHEANRYLRLDERQSQRSTKPAFSAPRKPTTPRKETPSPKSEKGSIRKHPSQKKVEAIKEEQFEDTVPNLEVQNIEKRQPRNLVQQPKKDEKQEEKQMHTSNSTERVNKQEKEQIKIHFEQEQRHSNSVQLTQDEETKSVIEGNEPTQQSQGQQPNIYKKPMMMLKKR